MGGAAPQPTGKGGKKPVDAAINLVPFIDLLSCCLAFLLITAVWTQLARMDVQQKSQGAAGATPETPPEEKKKDFTIYIDKDGHTLAASTGESTAIPLKDGEYDYAKLAELLLKAKEEVGPDKNDISIKADDAVIYDKVIRTIDTAITCGRASGPENKCFPDISLSDKGQGS